MHPAVSLHRFVLGAVALSLALVAVTGARAADPPASTYAVLSLVGDQINVVKRRMQTGTRLSPNELLELPVADATFDRTAMVAAEAAILRAKPGANVLQASIRDKRLFALQGGLLVDAADSRDLRAGLQGLMAKYGATHLVIVTKQRSPASFKIVGSTVGQGLIEGIGFYVDPVTPMVHEGSNEESPGFLCTFAYLRVTVLDAVSMKALRAGTALESRMYITPDSKDAVRAWDTLPADKKVDALEAVIRSGVARATADAMAN